VDRSLEERLAEEARKEFSPELPSDHQTPLDEQLDRLVFEQAISNTPQFTYLDITGDRNRGTDPFAHARAYYARCLHPEIDSDPKLHLFLQRFKDELDRLGFTNDDGEPRVPSREAIRRFRQDCRSTLFSPRIVFCSPIRSTHTPASSRLFTVPRTLIYDRVRSRSYR